MGQWIEMPRDRVNQRHIAQLTDLIQSGGVAIIPTDSSYSLVCEIGNPDAIQRIRVLRQLRPEHHFTLLCGSLSHLATYAEVSNQAFRFIKTRIPGLYTFILKATKAVPSRLKHPKRKSIGLRVPDHSVTQAVLANIPDGLLGVSLSQQSDVTDWHDALCGFKSKVDMIIESGAGNQQTTVVDLTGDSVVCIRVGDGPIDWE